MSSKALVLTPDTAKLHVITFGLSAFFSLGAAVVAFLLLQNVDPGLAGVLSVAAGIGTGAAVFLAWGKPQHETHIELDRNGLKLVDGPRQDFYEWRHLSRFTLMEVVSKGRNDHESFSHQLTARLLDTNSGRRSGRSDR
ncbi:hypothetical protein ACFQEX_00655 [Roseibium salinum]|uniref:hypothetical protein n=1 Tax=Roseibium salinum TaxID=1604349 RepID=UPI00361ECFA7